jgi:hypothetical protein
MKEAPKGHGNGLPEQIIPEPQKIRKQQSEFRASGKVSQEKSPDSDS